MGHFVPLEAPEPLAAAMTEVSGQARTDGARGDVDRDTVESSIGVTVREATAEDGPALAQLDASAWLEATQVVPPAAASAPLFTDHRRVGR